MKYLMKLAYVGTDFCGFQIQPTVRTVQGVLNQAFLELFGPGCKVTSCSRTDSGVHANASSLTVELPNGETPIAKENLAIAVSHHLPDDVSVFDVSIVEDSFHVRHDVKKKEYLYKIHNSKVKNPFYLNRVWHYPKPISDEGIENMKEAAKVLLGTHDFAAFQAQGSIVDSTVRTLYYIQIDRVDDIIEFRVCADGFLYNMVRILVGTLIDVACGRKTKEDVKKALDSMDRTQAGMTAPPEGLYLNHVYYEDN